MKTIRIAALAALVLAAGAVGGVLRPGGAHGAGPAAPTHVISVTGTGSVSAVPDRGSFSFGVVSRAKTAAAALQANGSAAGAVVAALRQAGIAAADIQTSRVSLDQRTSDDGNTVVGYTATTSVEAQFRDLAKAGPAVDAAVAAGADTVEGPSLSVSDADKLYRDALRAAVADAQAKAEALAAAAHVTLGEVQSINEGGTQPAPLPTTRATPGSSTDIEPGTQQVQASVAVTFAAT